MSVGWSGYIQSLLRDLDIHMPAALTASPGTPVTLADGMQVTAWFNLPAFLVIIALTPC